MELETSELTRPLKPTPHPCCRLAAQSTLTVANITQSNVQLNWRWMTYGSKFTAGLQNATERTGGQHETWPILADMKEQLLLDQMKQILADSPRRLRQLMLFVLFNTLLLCLL